MRTYISILRGINVSGQKMIKMEALRKTCLGLGFQDVITYVQSGNVIFTTDQEDAGNMERLISARIQKDFGFEVPVMVLTIEKLKRIIDQNTFPKNPDKDESYLHVTFLSSTPSPYDKALIESRRENGEEISFSDEAVYLYCPNGYGRTKLNNNFLETKLKVEATTRNWRTTKELLKIAEQIV
jgi:uncharacterized protein (DUF1697 family)